jgi:hypothetical protein
MQNMVLQRSGNSLRIPSILSFNSDTSTELSSYPWEFADERIRSAYFLLTLTAQDNSACYF